MGKWTGAFHRQAVKEAFNKTDRIQWEMFSKQTVSFTVFADLFYSIL